MLLVWSGNSICSWWYACVRSCTSSGNIKNCVWVGLGVPLHHEVTGYTIFLHTPSCAWVHNSVLTRITCTICMVFLSRCVHIHSAAYCFAFMHSLNASKSPGFFGEFVLMICQWCVSYNLWYRIYTHKQIHIYSYVDFVSKHFVFLDF